MTTLPATGVWQLGASLHGSVDSSDFFQWWFELGTTTAYGDMIGSAGNSPGTYPDLTLTTSNLAPGTTYHYRIVVAVPSFPPSTYYYGDDQTFQTSPPTAPFLYMLYVSPFGGKGGARDVLFGINTGALDTTVHIDFGTTPSYGSSTADQLFDASQTQDANTWLNGLTVGQKYYYRVVATNALATTTTYGSFTEVPGEPSTTLFPKSVHVESGTVKSGNARSLKADDTKFLKVRAAKMATSWYGSFLNVPNSLSSLDVRYKGSNSTDCHQLISVYNFTTGAWVQVADNFVATTQWDLAHLVAPGPLGDFVSGNGEVRVQVACSTAGPFVASGGLLSITYHDP